MPRHTHSIGSRLAPVRRAAATAGATAALLVVAVGGVAAVNAPAGPSPAAPGHTMDDLLEVAFPLDGAATGAVDGAAVAAARGADTASRGLAREEPAAGLPTDSAEAQAWIDEVAVLEDNLAEAAALRVAEAARVAAELEAARLAAEAEAARVAAEEVAAAEEAARVAAEEETARRAAAKEAERVAANEAAAARSASGTEASAAGPVVPADPGSSRAIAQGLLAGHGWGGDQWPCLDKLWQKESRWSHTADNPSSSAYGIPQALPGSKMSSAGSDWATNPETQIRWGLGYISGRYGTPCAAWDQSVRKGWY